jgi:hypothetical protein
MKNASTASTPASSADIHGAWKINTRGGPVPLCHFVQSANNVRGTCVGPQAAGTVTGTVDGQTVRWRWQWVTYVGNAAAGFDFVGTLGADNTITGTVERREIGMSLSFTAERQAVSGVLTNQSLQNNQPTTEYLINSLQDAQNYYAQGPSPAVIASARLLLPDLTNLSDAQIGHRLIPGYTRQAIQHGGWVDGPTGAVIPGPVPSRSVKEAWNTNERPVDRGNAGIDPQIEARAWKLYPWSSQQNERTKYIIDEMNTAADRQQGHSYSVHVR